MLGLVVMSPGREGYYEREVARGVEDYMAEHGEAKGWWVGGGAAAAGLTGEVAEGALSELFGHGRHPVTGAVLGTPLRERSRSGFSLSLSAPKSVSVLWALASDEISDQVRAGHDAAVEATIGFLDTHAAFSRRGRGGVMQVDTEGLVAAVYRHRTSRALQPQLHSHVLVANRVRCADGRWRALDGRELFAVQTAAGNVYRSALRAELTGRLGVAWTPVDELGQADVAGVPSELLAAFSSRSAALRTAARPLIEDAERAKARPLTRGERAAILQRAALDTRPDKPDQPMTTEELVGRWRTEANRVGHPAASWLDRVVSPISRRATLDPSPPAGPSPGVDAAAVLEAVAAASSTFGRADVVKAVARLLPAAVPMPGPAVAAAIEAETNRVVASAEVVGLEPPVLVEVPDGLRRRDGMGFERRHGAARFSTRGTLALESQILDAAEAGRSAGVAVVATAQARIHADAAGLGADQARAVVRLCAGGEQVVCLVGPAGAGKSRSLAAAAAAFTEAGHPVRGLTVSASAARVLNEQASIPADTIARHLHTGARLAAGEVVFLDEAGMASTPDVARLVGQVVEAGAKLALVGDPRQLGPVGPGGLFRLLAHDTHAAELDTIRRFSQPWEADASLRLRDRDTAVLDVYEAHGRLVGGSQEEMIEAAFELWAHARAQGETAIVLAGDHDTVDQLAMRARAHLVVAGVVEADGLPAARGQAVGVGDDIMTLRNNRQLVTTTGAWVANGDRWHLTARHDDGSVAAVSLEHRGQVRLPADYLAEHVALAYATTIHKAQGVTVDRAVAVLTQAASAEQVYVAMTRGRYHNQALVICDPPSDDHLPAAPTPALSAREALAGIMARDEGHLSATETLRRNLHAQDSLAVLIPLRLEAQRHIAAQAGPEVRGRLVEVDRALKAAQHHVDQAAARVDSTARKLVEQTERVHRAEVSLHEAEHPGWLHRRHVETISRARRTHATARGFLDLAEGDHTRAGRDLTRAHEALSDAVTERDAVYRTVREREAWLRAHPVDVAHEADLARRIGDRGRQLLDAALADPPPHVIRLIGHPPRLSFDPARRPWCAAAAAIEAYRDQYQTPPDQVGQETALRGVQARHWDRVLDSVHEIALTAHPDLGRSTTGTPHPASIEL